MGTCDLQEGAGKNEYAYVRTSDVYCGCCGLRRQPESIPIFTPIRGIRGLGTSTVLFFESIKSSIYLFLIASIVYSIFPFVISLQDTSCSDFWCKLSTQTDWHYKTEIFNHKASNIEAFLGIILIVLWGILFVYRGIKQK